MTARRDYTRGLTLPGYWKFSNEVWSTLWRHKRLFTLLALLYMVLYALLVGVISQDSYQQLATNVSDISAELADGQLGTLAQGAALYVTTVTSGISGQMDAGKQAYAGLLGILLWLTVVWLLRVIFAGKIPRLRDGLYNAGAPIISTALVLVVLVIQALPVALAAIGYNAAMATGLLDGGVETMLFWAVFALLVAMSLYWMTSTFLALVIVTLPGMYPGQALRAAGDMVVGRRVRILLRVLWLILLTSMSWTIVVLPIILLDNWLKTIWSPMNGVPLVPGTLLVMSSVALIFAAMYIYILYRKVVDDDTRTGQN